MQSDPTSADTINAKLELFTLYKNAKYFSRKHDSYFQVYEELFRQYVQRPITFVEIGIFDGGSLFMWRDYFGPHARIIGIDLNPIAKRWEQDGFEIFIGDQADPDFWDTFYRTIGGVDIVLDDGGHANHQQIITTYKAISHIKDGGLLVVEDVHTSYFREFGNPWKYSFISMAKRVVDSVNSRYPGVDALKNSYGKRVFSVTFYQSIVAFHIDSTKCFTSKATSNNGISINAKDFRWEGSVQDKLTELEARMSPLRLRLATIRGLWRITQLLPLIHCFFARHRARRLRQYFH